MGFYHHEARTGVSRVVEHLLTGLAHRPGIRLQAAAPTHLPETMRYVHQTMHEPTPFAHTAEEQRVARFENSLLQSFKPQGVVSKVIRQGAYQTRKWLNKEQAALQPQQWPRPLVYHSPFYPIPDVVRAQKNLPILQTIHDLIPIAHPEWFRDGDQTMREVLKKLPPDGWVTTVSQASKDDFCAYTGFDPNRVVPIRLAASETLFYPVENPNVIQKVRQQFGLGDAPYLLSLATLEPRKNTTHLVQCFAELIESGEVDSDVKLVLVGTKGWKVNELLNASERLASRVVVTGFVPDQYLAPLYAGATAFVYPSLYEGFGLPPLEAMQCGLPVITSNVSSLPEVVGDAALLVSPTDKDALNDAILKLLRSETLRHELSIRAKQQASLFSWEKFIDEHIALYNRMVTA